MHVWKVAVVSHDGLTIGTVSVNRREMLMNGPAGHMMRPFYMRRGRISTWNLL